VAAWISWKLAMPARCHHPINIAGWLMYVDHPLHPPQIKELKGLLASKKEFAIFTLRHNVQI